MLLYVLRIIFSRVSQKKLALILSAFLPAAACSFDPAGIEAAHQDNNNNNNKPTYFCGNNIIEPGEVCDGEDMGGQTCISQGYESGELACLPDCSGFDTSACEGPGPVCGNNIREGSEVCDGTDLAGQTCISIGYNFGDLACLEDCSGFDTSACISSTCGNNIAEYGEVCDGTDLKGETCETQGFSSGELACLPDCSGFDTSACEGPGPVCGNDNREGSEVCDGTDLAGETCVSQGFYSGDLACLPDCSGFDTSDCSGYCGDGIVNGDEECDINDLGGLNTCADHGCRSNGIVRCNDDCTFDISECLSGHDEDGDDIDDNCDNCPSYYNPNQEDANSDGIGDVCEYPGDDNLISEIVVFDPFLNDESSWTAYSGTWNYKNDVVIGSRIEGGANYLHDYFVPIDVPYAVETTFYYDQNSPDGSSWTAMIFAWLLSGNLWAYECVLDRDTNHLGFWRINGGNSWDYISGAFFTSEAQNHHWRKLHAFYDGNIVACRYTDELGVSLTVNLSATNVWNDMSGQAGLRVYNERAVFTSFVIYR